MFSKELEALIEAALADGVLEEYEKVALVKRAQKEGVELDELEIYIQSIMQKRIQNQKIALEKETEAHERERRGNICPHCGTTIPPMTKICPNCGRAVNSSETSGDKELFALIDQISDAIVKVKKSIDLDNFKKARADCEALLKKADLFYGDNKKIQMLKYDLEQEIAAVEKKLKNDHMKDMAMVAASDVSTRAINGCVFFFMACCCFMIVPLFFSGFRNAMGNAWDKMLGQ